MPRPRQTTKKLYLNPSWWKHAICARGSQFQHALGMKTDKMLGIFCTIIFLLTYLFSFIFVMLDERALHYCATSIGYCCWNCRGSKSNICVKSLHFLMFGFLFLLNDIWTSVYGFWMETFVEYWRASEKKKPKNGKKKKLLNCIHTTFVHISTWFLTFSFFYR